MLPKLSENHELIELLKSGGIAVVRTDTLYGILARADNQSAVERVYKVKDRNPSKSCIILVDNPSSAYGHSTELDTDVHRFHDIPTSFLVESPNAPEWLLRQNTELAYRVPANDQLQKLLIKTGPLIAPSANPESLPPAQTIAEAKAYFGDKIDMYVDGGTVPNDVQPSRLLRVHQDGTTERLR